jgi:hypothetical protein
MNKTIDVEILDLSTLIQSPEDTFVLIRVDIGKMPAIHAHDYIMKIKKQFGLCEILERRNIQYSVIGCRSDGTQAVEVSIKYKDDEPVTTMTAFDEAMELVK